MNRRAPQPLVAWGLFDRPMSMQELRAFLEVVRRGSLQSAARSLKIPRTTLRRYIDTLEATTGRPLLQRSGEGVVPTEAGRRLAERGRQLESDFLGLLAAVRAVGQDPEGELQVLVQAGLHPLAIAPMYQQVRERWPQVHTRVRVHENPFEALLPDTEVVATLGGPSGNAEWISALVGTVPRRLLASRSYLALHGEPQSIEELAKHTLLYWSAPGDNTPMLPCLNGAPLPITPRTVSSDAHLLHTLTHIGQGIALVPDGGMPAMLTNDPLVPVMSSLVGDTVEFRIAIRRTAADLPRVRVAVEIAEQLLRSFSQIQLNASAQP